MTLAVCAMVGAASATFATAARADIVTNGATTASTPIGLAVRIEGGVAQPLQVRAGQTFYVNQIDMRVVLDASVDEGVSGLTRDGDFSALDWKGVAVADQSAEDAPNFLGAFTGRKFYRNAKWMEDRSVFAFVQVDAAGNPTAPAHTVDAGGDDKWSSADDFFVRRLRAIQWTYDCASRTNCAGAHVFQEEALVEVRDTLHPEHTFQFQPDTVALQVVWSQNPGKTYTIPVTQVASPQWDYGFGIDIWPITPAGPDGTYPVGSDITFQIQLYDGAGNPLHPEGILPSFNDVIQGREPSGIQYWGGLFEGFITYYRRKHMERQLLCSMTGPSENVGPIHTILDPNTGGLGPDGVIYAASPAVDGFMGQGNSLPSFAVLFGGLYYPPLWDFPNPSSFTFHVPADAAPGTYVVAQKGRRVYMGQDIPATKTISVQVGAPQAQPAAVPLNTGGCKACHNGPSSLAVVNHGDGDRQTCATCHAPLAFELEGPVYVRTHFLHSRSDRYPDNIGRCSNCHLNLEGIQRTSKSACLSCHKSYDAWHTQTYGALDNMFVGSETGAFQACSTTCHTDHPNSGLNSQGHGNANANGH
jgi:hypothetical protein